MTIQRNPKSRPLPWEDDVPAEPRVRRAQQIAPASAGSGRVGSGVPFPALDGEDDEFPVPARRRYEEARAPWWRPATKWGRILLGLGFATVVGITLTGGYIFKTYLERDSRFRVAGSSNIQASGLAEVTRGDLLPVFGEDIGRNIFFVPLHLRRKQLEKIPWVEKATVMRILPDQLRVSVIERRPVAFVRRGQQIGLVDANGVLLSMSPASMTRHHYSFPVVTGIDGGDPLPSRQARMAVYGRLIADLDSTGQHLSAQISEIDLTDPEDARVLLPEQGTDILVHFGDDQFLARYQRYKAHIAEWRQQYPRLASVDLRYEQQVVLEMAPGAGGAQTTSDDGKPLTDASGDAGNEAQGKPLAGMKADSAKGPAHKSTPKTKPTNRKHPAPAQKRSTASIPAPQSISC